MSLKRDLFLGIDTSTQWRSIGLFDPKGVQTSFQWMVSRTQGRDLLPKIENLLQSNGLSPKDLSGIGIANGPGSFTALRVGVSVAQGLGMGLDVPVVPVGSLDSYPYLLPKICSRATVVLPARSGEVFFGTYLRNQDLSWKRESVIECGVVEDLGRLVPNPGIWIGPGLNYYEEEIRAIFEDRIELGKEECRTPSGLWIAQLGHSVCRENASSFRAESVEIEYHQSHGALTIEQRKREQSDV